MRHDRRVCRPSLFAATFACSASEYAARSTPHWVHQQVLVVDADIAVVHDVGAVAVDGRMPWISMPGRSSGTRNGETSFVFPRIGSVLVIRKTYCDGYCAGGERRQVTHWSPSQTARVLQVAISRPPSNRCSPGASGLPAEHRSRPRPQLRLAERLPPGPPGRCAPGDPRDVVALLQLPDPATDPGEAAVGLGSPLTVQIAGGAERPVTRPRGSCRQVRGRGGSPRPVTVRTGSELVLKRPVVLSSAVPEIRAIYITIRRLRAAASKRHWRRRAGAGRRPGRARITGTRWRRTRPAAGAPADWRAMVRRLLRLKRTRPAGSGPGWVKAGVPGRAAAHDKPWRCEMRGVGRRRGGGGEPRRSWSAPPDRPAPRRSARAIHQGTNIFGDRLRPRQHRR